MRKTKTIKITDSGNELTFAIMQMSAMQTERWINRVLLLLAKGGKDNFDIPVPKGNKDDLEKRIFHAIKAQGMDGMLKILGTLSYEDIEPLYDELLGCCSRVVGNYTEICTKETVDTYIGEVKTLYILRGEVLKLTFSFFQTAASSQPEEQTPQAPQITISKNTRT